MGSLKSNLTKFLFNFFVQTKIRVDMYVMECIRNQGGILSGYRNGVWISVKAVFDKM